MSMYMYLAFKELIAIILADKATIEHKLSCQLIYVIVTTAFDQRFGTLLDHRVEAH